MLKAAISGAIDFSQAKLSDRNWWRKLGWVLSEMENSAYQRLLELKFIQNAAALTYEIPQTFKHHWEYLDKITASWITTALPWMDMKKTIPQNQQLAEMWKRYYGDPKDPEVAARIKRAADALNQSIPNGPMLGRKTL